jgi:hypothetical protein
MKMLFAIIVFGCSWAQAWQIDRGELKTWISDLKMSNGAKVELSKFFGRNDNFILGYEDQLFSVFKSDFTNGIAEKVNQSCSPSFVVDFNMPTHPTAAETKKFEEEMLRLESVDCLPALDLEKVVQTFLSDNFQKKYIDGLKFSSTDADHNWMCQRTSVFPLGNSDYCAKISIWEGEDEVILYSLNELNNNTPSAPVYLRAMVTVFKKLSQGQIILYNLTYGRGPDLPLHGIVKSRAAKQHVPFIEGLIKESR